MTLQEELQINIVMSNYNQRSGCYSSNYDYIFLDNLANCSYSNLFRSDLKNLKIKTNDKTECTVLYIPSYGSQPSAILVRVPVGKISQTTKLLLDVYDKSTTFSSTLTTGSEVLMFDANSDTYSSFFMNYSGLSINNDSTDEGKFLRAKYVPIIDGSSPISLFTTFASAQPLANNRVTVARFKRITGNVDVNDNATYHGSTVGSVMMQVDGSLTTWGIDRKATALNWADDEKEHLMFDGAKTLVMASSWDEYNHGSDEYKEFAGDNYFWTGEGKDKGLGIFAKDNVKLEMLDEYCDSDFKNFIALRVNDSFNLLGVWTVKGQINGEKIEYVGMIHEFFDENTSLFDENLIMCGDFNSNSIWDKQNRKKDKEGNAKNQTNMNRKLESCNLISTYHKLNNEEQGKESQSTFYLYRHLDKPYHIDYVYASEGIVTDLKILDAEDWIEVSDHVPIVFEID